MDFATNPYPVNLLLSEIQVAVKFYAYSYPSLVCIANYNPGKSVSLVGTHQEGLDGLRQKPVDRLTNVDRVHSAQDEWATAKLRDRHAARALQQALRAKRPSQSEWMARIKEIDDLVIDGKRQR